MRPSRSRPADHPAGPPEKFTETRRPSHHPLFATQGNQGSRQKPRRSRCTPEKYRYGVRWKNLLRRYC